jgi:hypothetical protein
VLCFLASVHAFYNPFSPSDAEVQILDLYSSSVCANLIDLSLRIKAAP